MSSEMDTRRPSSPQDDAILEHYKREASTHALEPSSTMLDLRTRELEVQAILSCVGIVTGGIGSLLEIGCGNGFLLGRIREQYPEMSLTGIDFSQEMVSLAKARGVPGCTVARDDVRELSLDFAAFDVVVSERCLINLMDEQEQHRALDELCRVLRPDGFYISIEAFTDGLENLNRARNELGLPNNEVPYHNRWFDKSVFISAVDESFRFLTAEDSSEAVPPSNFLSSHYFVSRVLYPAVTQREILYNTAFVNFFDFVPPRGNFSPIQFHLLQKRG